MYQSFEELDVWKRACQLAVSVYLVLKELSKMLSSLARSLHRSAKKPTTKKLNTEN